MKRVACILFENVRQFPDVSLGNRAAPPPPPPTQTSTPREDSSLKKKEDEEDEDEETSSSSEDTESETEEESENETHPSTAAPSTTPSTVQDRQRNEQAMARTDIGPLLARSAEARRGSKEDSPSTRQVHVLFTFVVEGGAFARKGTVLSVNRLSDRQPLAIRRCNIEKESQTFVRL